MADVNSRLNATDPGDTYPLCLSFKTVLRASCVQGSAVTMDYRVDRVRIFSSRETRKVTSTPRRG